MEQPQENQAGPGAQPPTPPLEPGTIIEPQASTAPPVPPVAVPKPAPPVPTPPPQAAAPPGLTPVKPVIEKVPVIPAPPATTAVPAMKPVEERLITRPGIELRPMEVKPISPPGSLKNQISTATHPAVDQVAQAAQIATPPPKPIRIYEKIPYRLSFIVIVAVAVAIFSLMQPVKTPSADAEHINLAAAAISLVLCIGLLGRSNLARSLFVTVNIAAVIIQIFVIYQIRSDYSKHPAQEPIYTKSIRGYTEQVTHWLDPTYHQANQRLLVMGGELFTVFAMTTLSMGKVFEKRP